jgi:hypothetical protein
MKEGFDREIDSLLRRRARGTAESRPWGDGREDGTHSAHLDADELGAFAEGALPAPARLAAASHLADCDSCRGVVVGLARVAGVGAEVKQHLVAATAAAESARPSAWRAFVASLFAPRMMRFAVPLLALSLVGVVSYIALRTDRGSLQAVREGRSQNGTLQSAPSAPASSNTVANSNTNSIISQNGNAPREAPQLVAPSVPPVRGHGGAEAQPAEGDTAKDEAEPSAASPPAPPPPAAVSTDSPVDARLSKAAPKPGAPEEGEAGRADNNKEKSENRDKSARQSDPGDDLAANDAAAQQRVVRSRNLNEMQMPDGGARNQTQKRAADNNASGGYIGGGSAGATAQPKESERNSASRSETGSRARPAREAEKKADEDEVVRIGETRSAAGHRFRRVGNMWEDVNYKSSMPMTGVRRGTEGFRALVADVPEVGRVAAAIGGEVVIVIGGHAYRIR